MQKEIYLADRLVKLYKNVRKFLRITEPYKVSCFEYKWKY